MKTGLNALTMEVYSSGTTPIIQAINELARAGGVQFATGFPAGLYLDGSFILPRQILRWMPIKGNQRVVLRNGQRVAYEGWIDTLDHSAEAEAEGVVINLTGGWGRYMMRRGWNKRWADQEITEAKWPVVAGASEDKYTVDRYNRLMAVPKDGVSFTDGNAVEWQYSMPTGETIKRIVFNYNLQEGAQAWELLLYDVTNSFTDWNVTASGTGTQDETLSTPAQTVKFIFKSRASQTGIGDGSIFGRISGVTVYSETGSINLTEIAKDIRGEMAELNTDDGQIGSNTLDLTPFVTQGHETMANILTRATERGDSSYNSWAAQLLESEYAATPNGEPVLSVLQYPALSDYDYAVRIGDDNLVAPFQVSQDFSQIANWIVVEYQDGEGKTQYLSPDDDADLTNATSTADYGQRETILSLGHATSAEAEAAGRRYLARWKDPLLMLSSPITVNGFIRSKTGNLVPSSLIRAGKRIRVEDYPLDLSGQGLTFMIGHTQYSDESETCAIQAGPPPDLIYALSAPPVIEQPDPVVRK